MHEDIDQDTDPYCNPVHPPLNLSLLPNFSWAFIHGFWILVPIKFSKEITNRSMEREDSPKQENLDIWNDGNLTYVSLQDTVTQMSEWSGQDGDSFDSLEMEDSESNFVEKVKRLLHTGQTEDPAQGTRRSEW